MKHQRQWIVINWGNETYKIPKDAVSRHDYRKGTKARQEMYRLECAVINALGETDWLCLRDRKEIDL